MDTVKLHFCLYGRLCNGGNQPFYGKTISATLFAFKPFLYVDDDDDESIYGVVVDMFKVLSHYLHFDYNIEVGKTWFEFYPNGTIGEAIAPVIDNYSSL